MICPNDNTAMREVRIVSHYGLSIIIDQCPECGGIWFDRSELFMARSGEAKKIDLVDPVLLSKLSVMQTPKLVCPRDRADLVRFTDKFFPEDIILVRCPVCGGMWFNRGEFVKYQAAHEEIKRSRENRARDDKFEKDVKQILTTDRGENAVVTLDNLGRFLNTPVDNVNPFAMDTAKEQTGAQRTLDIIMNILSLVLGVVTRGRFL